MSGRRKLVLCMVDSLRTDILLRGAADGVAPTFAELLARGELVEDCVAPFPSVTPVCCSEIVTGTAADRHWISGSNWYHRSERRYVEYGSSFEATRVFGLFRTLYDIVYNMNMSHLSDEVETVFERLGDAGLRTACTPFLIYRGRTRHELGLEGLLRRVALAASFRHATWGPDELFYGELYSSRKVPCKPTLARPGTRDEYSACVGRELVAEDLYDFLLFSLPDNDYHSHKLGPDAQIESIAPRRRRVRRARRRRRRHRRVPRRARRDPRRRPRADRGRARRCRWPRRSARSFASSSRTPPSPSGPRSRSARSPAPPASTSSARRRARPPSTPSVRARLAETDGVDLHAWLADDSGEPVIRAEPGPPPPSEVVVERRGATLRFKPRRLGPRPSRTAPGSSSGDLEALAGEVDGGPFESADYPDALGRLWSALTAPHAPDIAVSAAAGYELVDWGGMTHCPGGSHGSLLAGDSLGPLVTCGLEGPRPERDQWALADVAEPRARPFRPRLARAREPTLPPSPLRHDGNNQRSARRTGSAIRFASGGGRVSRGPATAGISAGFTSPPAARRTGSSCSSSGSSAARDTSSTCSSSRCSPARPGSTTSPPRSAPSPSR